MASCGPERPMSKVISKPDWPSSLWVTSSLRSAWITLAGTGTATVGPITSVTRTPRGVMAGAPGRRARGGASWRGPRRAQRAPEVGGQVGRVHRVVRVADAPEVRRVAQRAVGDQ